MSVNDSKDFSVLTRNKFDSLTVAPSLEESCNMADIDLVVAHSQENDTDMGLNLLTVDPSLQDNCLWLIVVARIHTTDTGVGLNLLTANLSLEKDCHVMESGLVVGHTQQSDTNVGLNPSHNNLTVKVMSCAGTACDKENIVEKAKKQIGTLFGCRPLSIKLFTGESTYYDKI